MEEDSAAGVALLGSALAAAGSVAVEKPAVAAVSSLATLFAYSKLKPKRPRPCVKPGDVSVSQKTLTDTKRN